MASEPTRIRVWDLPTRTFHWVLALCVVGSLVSAWIGGNAMVWHQRIGYLVFALLAFRLVWGIVGGRWSRFATFVRWPSATWRYVRGRSAPGELHHVGHNPLGAWSVIAMLGVLAAQVGSGLFADDEIMTTGPLVRFVSGATSGLLTTWHTTWGQWLILGLVGLHLAAVLFYLLRHRTNLIGPMLHGDKHLTADVPASIDNTGSRLLALAILALCGVAVAWLVSLGG
jgi:cytochrome b